VRAGGAGRAGGVIPVLLALAWVAAGLQTGHRLAAQQPARTPRAAAPIDLTGTWVSVVSEDWRWRMVMPRKGDYASVPLSPEGRKAADTWDPSKLATDGCRPYGAAAVMRVPGRIKVGWDGESALKIETDAGAQTRLLRFGSDGVRRPPSWQGTSIAEWEQIPSPGGLGVSLQQAPPRPGTLKVTTTNLRAGYLRKNGVPYSERTTMTEYFDRVTAAGIEWLTVYTVVQDPKYLAQPFITSTHFKREPDASKWSPSPCEPRS
jgi:hypothetical protein